MSSSSSRTTVTQRDQWMVEREVGGIYSLFAQLPPAAQSFSLEIHRDSHVEYLTHGLRRLAPSFGALDASRPWLCYWIIHSLALLGEPLDAVLEDSVIDFLSRCQDPSGGYGGGPGQLPHLATTYAAVNSLITLGGSRSLSSINRDKVYNFLRQMKQSSGAFRMHDGGEIDVRACYTAISVASSLNILDDGLAENVGDFILSCQTYEGGIAGEPGSEAHGGNTFCGLATMILINEADRLDLSRLIDWMVYRQGVECGFQGRANKLVDGCYSFWQGGACALLQKLRPFGLSEGGGDESTDSIDSSLSAASNLSEQENNLESASPQVDGTCQFEQGGPQSASCSVNLGNASYNFVERRAEAGSLFNSLALQQYVLLCSQLPEGGFRDKPGKSRDFYHTCYCLSGLTVCQYSWSKSADSAPLPWAVVGPYSNLLEPIHPLHNVVLSKYHEANEFFKVASGFVYLQNSQSETYSGTLVTY
ncbi:LOW QUALITY PROTEIN: protein farnesyltransferase subunit beta [Syzygium oleosum]|uniref:LOW QUALITY PROTEIN: protein farnesyltransferase subunit beta n=1 Tax=Syzygium oleosum TaxID=219896 RepID=UPI0024B922D0|nr:LOW QUALITY PROTEIN: protein farnesyltransferase subunit beta [Syzygium oleosum]